MFSAHIHIPSWLILLADAIAVLASLRLMVDMKFFTVSRWDFATILVVIVGYMMFDFIRVHWELDYELFVDLSRILRLTLALAVADVAIFSYKNGTRREE